MRKFLFVLCAVLLSYSLSLQAQTVLCESIGDTYRECHVGTSGTIRLVMEMSDRLCMEGVTWGTSRIGVVWVTRGCRATFRIGDADAPKTPGRTRVVCESKNGNREICPADTSKGIVLVQQLSKTRCIHGESWDFDPERELVWVDHGCRAEFRFGSGADAVPGPTPLDAPVICESENGKRKTCKADTSAGVQIVRQLGDSTCNYNREWGYDANGIWVTKGCRAEFVVRGKPKVIVSSVTCESMNDERNHCAADTQFGVAVFRKLSERDCILGETWGFDQDGVWVDDGCHAQFALGGYRLPPDTMPANASKVTCESIDGGRKPCPVDTSRGVGLLRQISGADCVLNRTWGYDRNGIWVTDGCRAEFIVAR
jgi:hypothetical protein